jgi:hypothetical protein
MRSQVEFGDYELEENEFEFSSGFSSIKDAGTTTSEFKMKDATTTTVK